MTTPRPSTRERRALRSQVIALYGTDCHLCHQPIPLDVHHTHPRALQLDHLIPVADGGPHTVDNLRPAHADCNKRRGLATLTPPAPAPPHTTGAEFFKPAASSVLTSGSSLPPAKPKTPDDDDQDQPFDPSEWLA